MKRFTLLTLSAFAVLPAFAEDGAFADYERNLWVKIISALVVLLIIAVHTVVTLI